MTFAYCTKWCIDVGVLRGRPLTHVDAKPQFIYRTFPFFFLHENSQRGCIKGKKFRFFKGRHTQSPMEASIARNRTRLGRSVLPHQLAQVCASSCIMSCFSCATRPLWCFDTQSVLIHFLPKMGLRKSRYLKWDVCKSPGFPSNRVAAGQVDPLAVRITMVCSLFACCLSASKAFLFLSGTVCWVFSNAYTKEEHLLVCFRG